MAQTRSVRTPSLVTTSAQSFADEDNSSPKKGRLKAPRGGIARRFMNAVRWAEQRNRAHAVHGNPPVYDSRAFPWVAELESNWTAIRGELAQLMMRRDAPIGHGDHTSPTLGEDRGWTTFVLASYFRRDERNIAQCPETWRLLQRVPGLVSAMFSVLEPGKRLPAHHGPYNGLLRLHLGLIVPEPREAVGIRIDGEVHHWEEGRTLIFDDTFEHEARNESRHTRVVLFIDFERPLKFTARHINRRLLRSYFFSPFVREGAQDQSRWARRFYRAAQAIREEARESALQIENLVEVTSPALSADAPPENLTLSETLEREWPANRKPPSPLS
ncbi:aspartyl/asparaginyl beta-hydroxylase domain-containing protein [Bradyrhizobium sp. LHD-71]|uniref:aspartyl/asparaginyl beta-hydroxylase domain-containing protein n=1 Tax=Bradyrhizobium sp. LHD-71 TaxID=3072141 RepID=UPI00280FB635|nr:aspartyl/asparaginyl beta-hydroxylase domain-containing protein [Bradyrhizobium sp. LHD-71]MDQ8728135.1 aspartyl/asparaginyl beta-hydroxylase domain-containing protein [Bradyrhizobium sp. LHD-71]